ncbi:intersectin-1-like [Gossypium australe]|uniref:Intersectin-1-like n=1 Tax=Gossypium australe TaxID=47621 RepID=A0A5B6X4L3_9ROSI|nr:intersectin-1-like [Gossypium australe]
MKKLMVGSMTTFEYSGWFSGRINDNIPRPSLEGIRSIEEYLQVVPSELEIIKQDFKKRNRELEKRIQQLEEHLKLDADIQKLEDERQKKRKNKAEEELDSLKTDYKKLRLSMRTAGVGKTSEQWRQEIQTERTKADQWKKKFQEAQTQREALERSLSEAQNDKGKLKARVAELEKVPYQYRNRNSAAELRVSLSKIEEMNRRIEELESVLQSCKLRKDMQEQMKAQMQEQLVKIQQDMMDKMMESQRNMMTQMTQMTQLLNGLMYKRKSPMVNVEENTKYPQHPPGSGDNPIITIGPDLDKIVEGEKTKVELPKQLEDRCKLLEENFKVIESADNCYGIDAKDLSLVPDLVLPYKFKMPEFEKYNGTSCPEAHVTMFCRRMAGYINNDQLLIHCFQDSLVGAAAKWYNKLSRARIGSWRDLAQHS